MSRYIDVDKLIDDIRPFAEYDSNRSNKDWVRRFEIAIDAQPPADVVEVVRCKDCKHRPIDTKEEGNGFDYEFPEEYGCPGYCDDGYYAQRFDDNFYCAWAERADA